MPFLVGKKATNCETSILFLSNKTATASRSWIEKTDKVPGGISGWLCAIEMYLLTGFNGIPTDGLFAFPSISVGFASFAKVRTAFSWDKARFVGLPKFCTLVLKVGFDASTDFAFSQEIARLGIYQNSYYWNKVLSIFAIDCEWRTQLLVPAKRQQ